MNLLGTNAKRPPKPLKTPDSEEERVNRIADQAAREEARRRIVALDLRVDVLTRRMTKHERKQSH